MPAKKQLYLKLLDQPWDATHFTREEGERAVRKVVAEERAAEDARRQRRIARAAAHKRASGA
jgi:hypothetical protein